MVPAALSVHTLPGLPEILAGTDLPALLKQSISAGHWSPEAGDIVAIAQKIVSKAEGRLVSLKGIAASARARQIATVANKDPRVVELILRESTGILRVSPGVIIAEHRLGIILANAGIDRSNIAGDPDQVLLLPLDPDASARRIREQLEACTGVALGVLITDSIGRPWRLGTTGVAIGCAGLPVLCDLRGEADRQGRPLQVSETAVADSIAAVAVLLMGEAAESTPVAIIRGLAAGEGKQTARALLRPADEDLFR